MPGNLAELRTALSNPRKRVVKGLAVGDAAKKALSLLGLRIDRLLLATDGGRTLKAPDGGASLDLPIHGRPRTVGYGATTRRPIGVTR